jgi:hypothetical protein
MEFVRSNTPEKLTYQYIVQNSEYSIQSQSKNWKVWIWYQIVLLRLSGVWDPGMYPHHFGDFWDIFCERRRYWDKVYFIVDANDMPVQSEEFRYYVKTNWLHLIEREDFSLCIVENNAMKRAIWGSMYKLLGIQNKIRLFKSFGQACTWIKTVVLAQRIMEKKWGKD